MELPAPTAGHAPRIDDKVHEAPLKSRRPPAEASESMHCHHPAPMPSKKAAKSSDLEPIANHIGQQRLSSRPLSTCNGWEGG